MTLRLFTRTDLERVARLAATATVNSMARSVNPGGDIEIHVAEALAAVADTTPMALTRDDMYDAALLAAQLVWMDRDMEKPDFDNIAARAVKATLREAKPDA